MKKDNKKTQYDKNCGALSFEFWFKVTKIAHFDTE